jgi:hypothetical protein
MTKHTEGRLRVERFGNDKSPGPRSVLIAGDDSSSYTVVVVPAVNNKADAERLVSAWNAFAGVPGDPETLLENLLAAARIFCEDRSLAPADWEQLRAAIAPFAGKKGKE